MRINEMADPTASRLLGVAQFLLGRAENTNGKKQINTGTFVNIAQSLGIEITPQTLADLSNQPPLNGVIEPIQPGADTITFSNGQPDVAMPVDQAQNIVANAAKSAAKKDRGV